MSHRSQQTRDKHDPIADSLERADLRRLVRDLVDVTSPPARTRQLDEDEEFDERLFTKLAEAGLLAIGAPQEGTGDIGDQLVVIEELAAGPTSMAAFLISHYAATHAIGSFARNDQHNAVFEQLLAGTTKGLVRVVGTSGRH